MPTPFAGTSEERLLALVNSDNNTEYELGTDLTFGAPTAHAGSEGRNTRVKLIPVDTTQFSEQDIFYTRLNISEATNQPEGVVGKVQIADVPFTIHDILDDINAALGLELTPDEVQDQEHTTIQATYPLTIVEGSYGWLPSTLNFEAEVGDDTDADADADADSDSDSDSDADGPEDGGVEG